MDGWFLTGHGLIIRLMVRFYVFLASSCISVGIAFTIILLLVCSHFNIDITGRYVWLLAIPVTLSVALNITLIELWRKYLKKHR